jgi:flagellar biosynthesis protein FlhB
MSDEADSGDKTEPASPRKREEMRKEGNFARSMDLNQAMVLLGGLAALTMVGTSLLQSQVAMFQVWVPEVGAHRNLLDILHDHLPNALMPMLSPFGAIMLATFFFALAVQVFQAGLHVNTDLALPKFERMNPLGGIQRLFSSQSLITLAFGLIKLGIIGYIGYRALEVLIMDAPGWWQMPLETLAPYTLAMIVKIAWKCTLPLMVIGVTDYAVRWWKSERDMRMSKQELKEESKQQEGDQQIKARIRQIARQKIMRRMLKDVPKATVIVTNPTHVSIALRYEPGMNAPLVLAKGEDFMALKIREVARAHDVPIIEEPPLARALLRTVQIGQEIPIDFYRAVAEVLALLHRRRQNVAPAGLARWNYAPAQNGNSGNNGSNGNTTSNVNGRA